MKSDNAKLIFLIGFMGAGKSHEGKLLASNLGLPFVDLDEWIQEKEGATIASIFSNKGEEYFRAIERDALNDIYSWLNDKNQILDLNPAFKGVVATGGGSPCFFDNMDWMNQHGLTIWLNLPVEVLAERLKEEKSKRPLIANKSDNELKQFISVKLAERSLFYSRALIHVTELSDSNTLIQLIKDA